MASSQVETRSTVLDWLHLALIRPGTEVGVAEALRCREVGEELKGESDQPYPDHKYSYSRLKGTWRFNWSPLASIWVATGLARVTLGPRVKPARVLARID